MLTLLMLTAVSLGETSIKLRLWRCDDLNEISNQVHAKNQECPSHKSDSYVDAHSTLNQALPALMPNLMVQSGQC